ncbi:hypothetical protein A2858_02690 [Candidatus Daviesbacteria bacterium RIFCSPHIGHO2_01_FULL_36_37]|uniref:Glycosyl transferase, WecB/TagA/CpsF family n=3 Tax=Candidatus Daviesiibacteriota TaxID=1752718 RepID=A0A0G0EKT1_9BACT|nr:MAG: hypothetical protein US19_C0041G0024 [Candidatus Daviesbacteria bacterium GW2011_GWB1_36_5]KKQ15238.1 MAG: hypothetical protein US28_C0020G0018 [Candidatus Daviesbacteria bacterium GW2011_GWA1_36_8]OGE17630.1 MAG: hypothetical protein A2858_02690 [Candidatus Daviesbacteria bacterium RIFCSPHIGHO2_01_FULL_36_37]
MSKFSEIYNSKLFVNINSKKDFLQKVEQGLSIKKLTKNKRPLILFYIYLGSIYYAYKDKDYKEAIKIADGVYLDGFLIGWFLKMIYGKKFMRFGAEDYIYELFDLSLKRNKKIFLLGSSNLESGNSGAVRKINNKYHGIKIAGHHGYFQKSSIVIKKIKNFKPDILIIGLGLNRQEKWVYQHLDELKNVKVIIAVGNFIDILGGKSKLPPEILKKFNLRWVYRLIKEPYRLWERYVFGLLTLFFLTAYALKVKIIGR